jgi:hypothetical protein
LPFRQACTIIRTFTKTLSPGQSLSLPFVGGGFVACSVSFYCFRPQSAIP